jgi:hypothetical protein
MATSTDGNISGRGSSDDLKMEARNQAARVSEQAKQQAKNKLDQSRQTISIEIDKVAHAARAAASDLRDQNSDSLSSYVAEMAESMSSLATRLRGKNIDELMHEVTGIAKRNPALFVTGSLAIGFGLARFAKSSNAPTQQTGALTEGAELGAPSGGDYYGRLGNVSDVGGDLESRSDSTWTNDYSASSEMESDYIDDNLTGESYVGDDYEGELYADSSDAFYADGDYSELDLSPDADSSAADIERKQRMASERLRSKDKGNANDIGGHRYE